jgi:hypothetical protein
MSGAAPQRDERISPRSDKVVRIAQPAVPYEYAVIGYQSPIVGCSWTSAVGVAGRFAHEVIARFRKGILRVGRCGCSLGPLLDTTKHALGHQQADELDWLDQQWGPAAGVSVALADHQPAGSVGCLAQHERPGEVVGRGGVPHRDPAAQDQRAGGHDQGHAERDLRSEFDLSPMSMRCHSGTIRSALWMSQPTRFSRKS